jgi:histidinol-phosphate aminotransferase
MTTNFAELANPGIRNSIPYQPGKPIEEVERELGLTDIIKLASNENPLGPSPKALAAAQQALLKSHLYPDGGCYAIKQALAKFLNVNANQLVLGNGSENTLEIIIKAYLNSDSNAIVSQYAFATIPIQIKAFGAKLITIPTQQYRHDIQATIQACNNKTKIIFVVNPNNPTGTYTSTNEFNELLNAIPKDVLIVLDEAYSEYIDKSDYPNSLELLKQHPNLIISRTFSKIYGLAGLRIGYTISSPEIADILNRARLPFNLNLVASAAAIAALEDHHYVAQSIALNNQGREQLKNGLNKLNISFIPSVGNFITINAKRDGNEVYQALLHKGVIVRPLTSYGMPTHLRITIGTHEQNERFLQTLREVLSIS